MQIIQFSKIFQIYDVVIATSWSFAAIYKSPDLWQKKHFLIYANHSEFRSMIAYYSQSSSTYR